MRSVQKIASAKYNQSKPLFQENLAVQKNETRGFDCHCGMFLAAIQWF
jgi:hypothetical protein